VAIGACSVNRQSSTFACEKRNTSVGQREGTQRGHAALPKECRPHGLVGAEITAALTENAELKA
jgi:hypothetical protein